MNLSGNAVRYWMQKENIPLENVLVVVDDLALPFGTLRLKVREAMRDITALSILQYAGHPELCTPAFWNRQ